ncbi:MAG: sulfatase-like hydrolase/transferase [Verrucomicrobia bacterium]|nr:sulfatase-like hydrolase/transferase [Verrucomicrobiota bacterium]
MNPRPNVLFFFTDDQRFDTLRALGNDQIFTPTLDALVARGTTFTHAHIPGGTSGAVCMPSRAMLHTGRTLFHIDHVGQSIPADHTTIGECLKSAGYTTFGTGKWHNGRSSYARSFSTGAEICFDGMADHWNVQAYHFDPTGAYDTTCPIATDFMCSTHTHPRPCDHVKGGTHSTELFVDAAIEFVRQQDGTHPFFMYVSLLAPHDPRIMPERFLKMYDPQTVVLPENFAHEHVIDTGALDIRDELLAARPRDPQEVKRHIAEYYAMITHLDQALGRLLSVIEAQGELDNTIVVFAGDNGLAVGQHGLMGKQNLYDHSVRVPLIFAGPGIPQGERRASLAYLLDIFPTLCDLTGLDTPASVEGLSLAPAIKDPMIVGREALYLAYTETIRGVTDGKHKLIEYAGGETQLFNLQDDPREIKNLARDTASAEILTEMRSKMTRLAEAWDDEKHPLGMHFWAKRQDLRKPF